MNYKELIVDIKLYLSSLHLYDYVAYAWIFLLFVIFLTLSIVVRHRTFFSLLFAFLTLLSFTVLPVFVKHLMDGYIRKAGVQIEDILRFEFAKSLVATGEVTNEGQKVFSQCKVELQVMQMTGNWLLDFKNKLRPNRSATTHIEGPIEVGFSKPFKVTIKNFTLEDDYNTSIDVKCY